MKATVMKSHTKLKEGLVGYLFLLPWLIGFFLLTVVPMISSLYLSFTSYDMLNEAKWIGVQNFTSIFHDVKFIKSSVVTFKFVLMSVPLQLTFALIVALLLKKDRKGSKVFRAIYYLPSLFGSSVAVAILWRQLFNKDGLFNEFLALLGIKGISWIATPSTAIYTLILLAVWQFGSSMVIFLSVLKQIPVDYYEAATIDGATKVRQLFHITIPLLTPIVFFNIVMQVINAFQAFTSSYIISGGTGAPMDSTLFYTLYLYIRGFTQFQMGYASALAWILLMVIGLVTGTLFLSAKKWVYYD